MAVVTPVASVRKEFAVSKCINIFQDLEHLYIHGVIAVLRVPDI